MTERNGVGTAGSSADRDGRNYPAVPYTTDNFHGECNIDNWQDAAMVRDCELNHLVDLAQVDQSSTIPVTNSLKI